jgi:hypothetical protein
VARLKGRHKWNQDEFPTADRPVETVLVMVYKNADPLTGSYTMMGTVGDFAPPIP